MNDLEVVYSKYIIEPLLEKSRLTMPSPTSGFAWEYTDPSDACAIVKFGAKGIIQKVGRPFKEWRFYTWRNGVWNRVEWSDLTEDRKMAIFSDVITREPWLPFYDEDVLPPWEDEWFVLIALERM